MPFGDTLSIRESCHACGFVEHGKCAEFRIELVYNDAKRNTCRSHQKSGCNTSLYCTCDVSFYIGYFFVVVQSHLKTLKEPSHFSIYNIEKA